MTMRRVPGCPPGGTVLLTTLLTLLSTATGPAGATEFRGMEENCILSFVVPRDKVKSSCDVEQRVTRRLNAMETKVTLYKQHVQELQEQLAKEREFHRQRMEEINQRLSHSARAGGSSADVERQVEKRVQALEEEVRRIRSVVTSTSAGRDVPSLGLGEKPHGRGAGGLGLGLLSSGRSREEEEKAITNLVKTVVHSEVEKLFDNYTHYVGRYVRDQALAFNQIINMVPRHDLRHAFPANNLPPKWPSGNEIQEQGSTTVPVDQALLNELEGIRNRLNTTGRRLADHMHSVLSRVNDTASSAPKKFGATEPGSASPDSPTRDAEADSSLLDINDTSSGDTNDTTNDRNINLAFTQIGDVNTTATDGSQSQSLYVAGLGSASAAMSRMSHNADLNKLPDTGSEDGREHRPREAGSNGSGWQESMLHDQTGAGLLWVQQLLRTEMQKVLQQQVDEVLSLVSKQSAMVDTQLHDHDLRFSQLEQRLAADIKQLDQVVNGLRLEMTSVSQGLQALYSRTDRVAELEATVEEVKRNMSTEGNTRHLATLLDEQSKKVRKMERLTDIYKQSLEHYRNETKLEYRDLRDRLNKESSVLKTLNADLYHNVTEHVRHLNEHLNASTNRQVEEMKQRVQVMEDQSLLQQIDLSSVERQLRSKSSKAERDINKLSEDVGELRQKARSLQRNLDAVETGQDQLSTVVNASTVKVQNLQMEVKLNVLDDWVPYNFDFMKSRTDCFGEQFIRKSGFKTGRLVGVVLCTNNRYKIFLGQSLTDTFKNIGDDAGMGEDHCQFVNARNMAHVKVSPFRTSTETEPGYVRTHWGQEPRPELLNIIRPSPAWYECGVSIP